MLRIHRDSVSHAQQLGLHTVRLVAALVLSIGAACVSQCGGEGDAAPAQFTQPGLGTVRVYHPPHAVRRAALLISGDGGWGTGTDAVARGVAAGDTLVAGIDGAQFLAGLEHGPGCAAVGDELAALVRVLIAREHLRQPLPVILLGHSAGATLAYVALAQGPPAQFSGALTLSFCTGLDLRRPLCPAPALQGAPVTGGFQLAPGGRLPAPWIDVHGLEDRVCPAPAAEAFARVVPGAAFVGIPGVDHNYRDQARWWGSFLAGYRQLAQTP